MILVMMVLFGVYVLTHLSNQEMLRMTQFEQETLAKVQAAKLLHFRDAVECFARKNPGYIGSVSWSQLITPVADPAVTCIKTGQVQPQGVGAGKELGYFYVYSTTDATRRTLNELTVLMGHTQLLYAATAGTAVLDGIVHDVDALTLSQPLPTSGLVLVGK